jgi:hypothetical protein
LCWAALAPNRFKDFLAGVRTRDPLNALDIVVSTNESRAAWTAPGAIDTQLKTSTPRSKLKVR